MPDFSGFSPTLAGAPTAELPDMNATFAPRTVHLIPRGERWVLMTSGRDEGGKSFTDLGLALDAATRGAAPVHVVVHERDC